MIQSRRPRLTYGVGEDNVPLDWLHQFANSQPEHPVSRAMAPHLPPLFTAEGPQFYQQAFQHNQAFAKPGPYHTQLTPKEEQAFRQWVAKNKVPFDPNA